MAKEKPGVTITDEADFGADSTYISKSEKELRQLALDVISGQVFGSWSLRESELQHLGMVFMPMMFLDDISRKMLERNKIVHFYGHMKDTFDRSLNGLPLFYSVRVLDQADTERLNVWIKKLQDFMEEDV